MTLDNGLKIPGNDEEVRMAIAFLVRDVSELKKHIENFCDDSDRAFVTRGELREEYGPIKEGYKWIRRGFFWIIGLIAGGICLQLLYKVVGQQK